MIQTYRIWFFLVFYLVEKNLAQGLPEPEALPLKLNFTSYIRETASSKNSRIDLNNDGTKVALLDINLAKLFYFTYQPAVPSNPWDQNKDTINGQYTQLNYLLGGPSGSGSDYILLAGLWPDAGPTSDNDPTVFIFQQITYLKQFQMDTIYSTSPVMAVSPNLAAGCSGNNLQIYRPKITVNGAGTPSLDIVQVGATITVVENNCNDVAVTDDYVIVSHSVNGNDKVSVYKCSPIPNPTSWSIISQGLGTALPTIVSLAINKQFFFLGGIGSNNIGIIHVYNRVSLGKDHELTAPAGVTDFGAYIALSSKGYFLGVLAPKSNKVFVYYLETTTNKWSKYWEGNTNWVNTKPTSISIRETNMGFLLAVGVEYTGTSTSGKAGFVAFNFSCENDYYGFKCDKMCECGNGVCLNSMWATKGDCIACTGPYTGILCTTPCSCLVTNGICDSGVNATGKCLSCTSPLSYGPLCNQNCLASCAATGTCNSGIRGDGKCLNCSSNYYGSKCDKLCSCKNGICSSGINGTGECTSCNSTQYYGKNCDLPCACSGNGTCNSGLRGDGKCLFCDPAAAMFGSYCNMTCNCNNGICSNGINGTGTCLQCSSGYYGSNCTKCNCSTACSDGIRGNGTCSPCAINQFGSTCTNCSCLHGICNAGIEGDGKCRYCYSGFFNENCTGQSVCSDTNGILNDDINGNAECSICFQKHYGPFCEKCPCDKGTCDDGVEGTGLCLSCEPGYWGPYCNQSCNCVEGICNADITGDGTCTKCNTDAYGYHYYGINCDKKCECQNGTCSAGPSGDGTCLECIPDENDKYYFGQYCNNTCTCAHGICFSGPTGNGTCQSCTQDENNISYYGSLCSQPCTCLQGQCDSGIYGTGKCLTCSENYFGENCQTECLCENGVCDSGPTGQGDCVYCDLNYYGNFCNFTCECENGNCLIKDGMNVTCNCDSGYLSALHSALNCTACPQFMTCQYGNAVIIDSSVTLNNSVNGNIYISNSVINVTSVILKDVTVLLSDVNILKGNTLSINGNINSQYSLLELSSGASVKINGNVDITNTVWTLSSDSNINITGCLSLENVTINIYDEGNLDSSPVILSFSANCSDTFDPSIVKIYSLDSDPCTETSVVTHQNNFVLTVSLEKTKKSDFCLALPLWQIIIITSACIVVVTIIIVLIITCSKTISKEVFPFRYSDPEQI